MFKGRVGSIRQKALLNNDKGFSLLELSVAVGILLVLVTAVGSFTYSTQRTNAQKKTVETVTLTAYSKAATALLDYDPDTTILTALMDAQKENNDAILFESVNEAATVKEEICIKGTMADNPDISFTTGACSEKVPPAAPAPEQVVSKLTYKCDENTVGYLPFRNVAENTTIGVFSDNDTQKLNYGDNTNIPEAFMQAGTSYTVVVMGAFGELTPVEKDSSRAVVYSDNSEAITKDAKTTAFNKCLVSLDMVDNDTGLTRIGPIGGPKFKHTTSYIPSTIVSLEGMFYNASNFNDTRVQEWEVGNVQNFSEMFYKSSSFNQALDMWDVRKAETMNSMFREASSFDQNLYRWKVNNVKDMKAMFKNASSFNNGQGVDPATGLGVGANSMNWRDRVKNVKDMSYMFDGASKFNQTIYLWQTTDVTSMRAMFQNATSFNRAMQNKNTERTDMLDTSKVTDMYAMFHNAVNFNQHLDTWDTGNVTTMQSMFKGASSFNRNVSTFNMSKVTITYMMFRDATMFNNGGSAGTSAYPILWDDTSSLTNMMQMFYNAPSFNQKVDTWNTSNVVNMRSVFQEADRFNQSVSNWDTNNVTIMRKMFYNAVRFNNGGESLEKWNNRLNNVENVAMMFNGATSFTQDVSEWYMPKAAVRAYFSSYSGIHGDASKNPVWVVPEASDPYGENE